MNPLKLFLAYAAAFEETYRDDDWTRLEPFFTEDAFYSVSLGPPLGGRWDGRSAVLAHLRESVDELDRRLDSRAIDVVGEPVLEADSIEFAWRGTYQKAGCPDLVFGGRERATYREATGSGGAGSGEPAARIASLVDTMDEGSDVAIQGWMAEYFER